MWIHECFKKRAFLTRHKRKEVSLDEENLLKQFKEEISEELGVDKKNKEEK